MFQEFIHPDTKSENYCMGYSALLFHAFLFYCRVQYSKAPKSECVWFQTVRLSDDDRKPNVFVRISDSPKSKQSYLGHQARLFYIKKQKFNDLLYNQNDQT